jgi:hypothetical protein
MCDMNKNHLLDFFFGEVAGRERAKIRSHVQLCPQCRKYLSSLEHTRDRLHQWPDEKPRPDTLDQIMRNIPETKIKQAETKPAFHLVPLLSIPLVALSILITISLVKNSLVRLPIWQTLKNIWVVQQLGLFGMTAILFLLAGILITLLVTPILIFESQNKQYRFNI